MGLPADYHMHTPLCRHATGEPTDYAAQAVNLGIPEIGFSEHNPMIRDDYDDWHMLQGDLDAESIDFLDIVFRLEKSFGIKIERGELFPEDILTDTDFVDNGKVNAAGIAKLRERMPFADLSKFEANPVVQNLGKQLTVADMCNFVKYKLSA